MSTTTELPAATLTLTGEERSLLLTVLEHKLREVRVEEHRTDSFAFARLVRQQETLLEGLLEKVRQP
jgi:hypothetical protein